MRDIGKNIRDLRIAKNMTQDTLAELLFVTRQTVSNYETGRTRPDVDMVVKIAEILETDANTILYGIPAPPERKADIRRLIIAACILAILVPLYVWVNNLTDWYANNRYVVWPRLLLGMFASPALFLLAGWTLMQALGTFTKLSPLTNRVISPAILVFMGFYLAVMLTFLAAFFLECNLSGFWNMIVFGLLGALPGNFSGPDPKFTFFLLGILLWLFRNPKP